MRVAVLECLVFTFLRFCSASPASDSRPAIGDQVAPSDRFSYLEHPWLLSKKEQLRNFTTVGNAVERSNSFWRFALIARCRASCREVFGGELRESYPNSGFLLSNDCGQFRECEKCEEACGSTLGECPEKCAGSDNHTDCQRACSDLQPPFRDQELRSKSSAYGDLILDQPKVFCTEFEGDSERKVLLEWSLFMNSTQMFMTTSNALFVIESRTKDISSNQSGQWRPLEIVYGGVYTAPAVPAEQQFRVTAILHDGLLSSATSQWIRPVPRDYIPRPAADIRVLSTSVRKDGLLRCVVAFGYDQLPSCHYSLDVLPESKNARAQHSMRSSLFDVFRREIDGLEFSMNYSIVIRSSDKRGRALRGDSVSLLFVTPSCLELYSFDFSKCPPDKPLAARAQMIGNSGLRVQWKPPPHTTTINRVQSYEVTVRKLIRIEDAKDTAPQRTLKRVVGGAATAVDFADLDYDNSEYRIRISARSVAGPSEHTEISIRLTPSNFSRYASAILIFALCLLALVISAVLRRRHYDDEARKLDALESFIAAEKGVDLRSQPPAVVACETLPDSGRNGESSFGKEEYQCSLRMHHPSGSISDAQITFRSVLGYGAYGVVSRVKIGAGNDEFALKNMKNPKYQAHLREEFESLNAIGAHQHIVGLEGYVIWEDKFSIVMEYNALGDLKTFLSERKPLSESLTGEQSSCSDNLIKKLTQYCTQIASALMFVSSKGFVHGDVAARNVLLQNENHAKLADFGLAKRVCQTSGVYRGMRNGRLPIKWMAPEALKEGEFSEKTDMWSFGVLQWELFSLGDNPYESIAHEAIPKYIECGNRLERPELCPQEIFAQMTRCWNYSPEDRPTFIEIRAILEKHLTLACEYTELSI